MFLGDSFTWGEGLELYDDYFSNMRNNVAHWVNELQPIQNFTSLKFRENNRFPYLVSKEFNKLPIVDRNNGGSLSSNIRTLNEIKDEYELPEIIIFQFTSLLRNCYHFTYSCRCKSCLKFHWKSYDSFYKIMDVNNGTLESQDILFINTILSNMGKRYEVDYLYNKSNGFILKLLKEFEKYSDDVINKQLNQFLTEYVLKLEEKGHIVLFIDAWEEESSIILHKNKEIRKRMIPLIYDNIETKVWPVWERKVKLHKKMSIAQDYPKTHNFHPSLECHKLLANSVITYLKNNVF